MLPVVLHGRVVSQLTKPMPVTDGFGESRLFAGELAPELACFGVRGVCWCSTGN